MKKTCDKCISQDIPATVPFVVMECTVARLKRIIKRQWIALILMAILLFSSFVMFVRYEACNGKENVSAHEAVNQEVMQVEDSR